MKININVGQTVRLNKMPKHFIPIIRKPLIIENPQWLENDKHNRSNYRVPKKLRFISEDSKTVPRGFLKELKRLLIEAKIDYRVKHTTVSNPIEIESKISFDERPYGEKAVKKILKKRSGILEAPTGAGKTVIAIETICRRKERALIIVHTKELFYQWKEKLLQFTNLKEDEIGLLGDGKKKKGKVTIGIIDTLRSLIQKNKDYFKGSFGYIIPDECHRIPSETFSGFLINMNPKYQLGLSATVKRRDGLDLVINFFVGDIIHTIETKKLQKQKHILKPKLKMIATKFSPFIDNRKGMGAKYQSVIKNLISDSTRNGLIKHYVRLQAMKDKNGAILIVSERTQHCKNIYDDIKDFIPSVLITGATTRKNRLQAIEDLNNKKAKILIATGQLIGEGFDLKHLSSVFLTYPIKYDGKLTQIIGRILRTDNDKHEATIYDFNDSCWLLRGSYNSRMEYYKKMEII